MKFRKLNPTLQMEVIYNMFEKHGGEQSRFSVDEWDFALNKVNPQLVNVRYGVYTPWHETKVIARINTKHNIYA